MTAPTLGTLLRRAGDWLVEPVDGHHEERCVQPVAAPPLAALPPRSYPAVGVVGLARGCGVTTIARALAAELGRREGGAAVVGSRTRPDVVALGSSGCAVRLAESLSALGYVRPAGRLCLTECAGAADLVPLTRHAAPAVMEVGPGAAAVDAANVLDRMVLLATGKTDPALAAAVAETIARDRHPPVIAVNRAADHGPWLVRADILVPESRFGARLALAGREPRGWLGKSIEQLADLCAGA